MWKSQQPRMESEFRDKVIERILTVMRLRCVTQAQLSRLTGYSPSQISNWLMPSASIANRERMRYISLDQLTEIAKALDTSCDYLVARADDPSPPSKEHKRLPQHMVESALQHVLDAAQELRDAIDAQEAVTSEGTGGELSPDATGSILSTLPEAARRGRFARDAHKKRNPSHSDSDIGT